MVTKIEENNDTVSVKLAIYDMEFDITIDKNRIEEYRKVAKEVANRLNAYTFAFRDRKTEHQIALMTMIDIAVYPFKNQSEGVDDDIKIELSVCDETFNVSIKENDRELYERSAIRITKRYNSYLEHYKSGQFSSGSIQDCFSKTKRADLRLQSILSSRKQ